MSRLDELKRVFGGQIRTIGERTWLDTQVSGLRTFVIRRIQGATTTVDLAVFTPRARELDPFRARRDGVAWFLDGRDLPQLAHGFVFTGCRGGILFATHHGEASLEDIVATLWELGRWARHDWRPPAASATRRHHLVRWFVLALVLVAIWWLRCGHRDPPSPSRVDSAKSRGPAQQRPIASSGAASSVRCRPRSS